MSCEACEQFATDGYSIPYRWKHATVLIIACREHGKEILEALNKAQAEVKP